MKTFRAAVLILLVLAPVAQAREGVDRTVDGVLDTIAAPHGVLGAVPCLAYDITLPGPDGDVHAKGGTPKRAHGCESPVHLFWNASGTGGEGSLVMEIALPQMSVLSAGDAVPVPVGPAALVERVLGLFEVETPAALSGAPDRVVVRVRFSAAWLAPDCGDAGGAAEADAQGARVRVTPDPSFFQGLCRLTHDRAPDLAQAGALAAAALRAAARALPGQASQLLAAIDVRPAQEQAGAAAGEIEILAAPRDGEASASEDIRIAAAGVEARQASDVGGARPAHADAPRDAAPAARRSPAAPRVTDAPIELRSADAGASPAPEAPRAFAPALVPAKAQPVARVSSSAAAQADPLAPPATAVALGAGLALLLGLALYQRIRRPAALDHPARRALHAAAAARGAPALASDLARDAGLGRKAAEYHLRYLARLGILREERVPDAPRRFALPAARSAPPPQSVDDRLVAAVRERPGLSTMDAARLLGLKAPRADRRLKDLVLAGRLESRMRDRARRFFPV